MNALLSCLLITIIVIMLIGIVSVLKNSEQLSKRAFCLFYSYLQWLKFYVCSDYYLYYSLDIIRN